MRWLSDKIAEEKREAPVEVISPSPSAIPATPLPTSSTLEQPKQPIPKESEEERVKKARALLDTQIDQIAKRERLPKDLVRMELYLEARMRKTVLPKIDRTFSEIRVVQARVDDIARSAKQSLDYIQKLLEGNGSMVEPRSTAVAEQEAMIASVPVQEPAIIPPVEPPLPENTDDPLYGAVLLYLMAG